MSASPEFYKPAPPAFSPCSSPLLLHGAGAGAGAAAEERAAAAGAATTMWQQQLQEEEEEEEEEDGYDRCRTPTSAESQVKPPGTCPPAPRKPRAPAGPAPCRKRLFEVEVFSLRLEELERLFWRPHPAQKPPAAAQKKRRRVACPPEPKPKKKSS